MLWGLLGLVMGFDVRRGNMFAYVFCTNFF